MSDSEHASDDVGIDAPAVAAPADSPAPAPATDAAASAEPNVLVEGEARIPYTGDAGVFYNKVQVFNRDLSILVISAFVERRKRELRERHERRLQRMQKKQAQQQPANDSAPAPKTTATPTPVAESKSITSDDGDGDERMVDEVLNKDTDADIANVHHPAPDAGITILEALSATGLRSIRYYREIPHVKSITVNDFDTKAVAAITANIQYNGLSLESLVPTHSDAKLLMYQHTAYDRQFDVVDLDPYGSASEFFDSAVQSVRDGGLLCVTCTDKAVMCGSWGEVAYAKYGGYALKGKICHEQAVRLLLGGLTQAAARYKRYIQPLVSLSIDFYVRVFVRCHVSQLQVKNTGLRMSLVYQCIGCQDFALQRMGKLTQPKQTKSEHHTAPVGPPVDQRCQQCGQAFKVGGPLYSDPIHDPSFVDECLSLLAQRSITAAVFATEQRLTAMLNIAKRELPSPFYYSMSGMCQVLHLTPPKIWVVRAALIHAGHRVSDTHCLPDAIKTDAPSSVVWDIFRSYLQQNPQHRAKNLKDDSPASIILSKEPAAVAKFDYVDGCDLSTRATGTVKFLPNPETFWGPKTRAGGNKRKVVSSEYDGSMESQVRIARENQNKRLKKLSKVCFKWQKTGECRFGDNCKFYHTHDIPQDGSANQARSEGEGAPTEFACGAEMESSSAAMKVAASVGAAE